MCMLCGKKKHGCLIENLLSFQIRFLPGGKVISQLVNIKRKFKAGQISEGAKATPMQC